MTASTSATTDPPRATATTVAAVTAVGLVKVHGRGEAAVTALRGVDVSIGRGCFTAVMGPSGSGKSTLLHCLAGLDSATRGTVRLGGTELGRLSDREVTRLRRERLGFVFQSYNLLPMLTAEQNILLPLELAGRRGPTRADRGRLAELAEVLGISHRLTHRPAELSGGQQQRVAITRALINRPEVVFADEPTGNLDSHAGAEVLAVLRRGVRELGCTVVLVTHDDIAATAADRVLLLADGRVAGELCEPTPETLGSTLAGLRTVRSSEVA